MHTADTTSPCWVCGGRRSTRWRERSLPADLGSDDLRITDSRYGMTLALRRCPDCGFGFTDDPDADRLLELYEDLSDPGYEETQDPRALQMCWLVESARTRHPAAASALDVGAGTGLLVEAAAGAGLRATGVEPSRSLVRFASDERGVELLQGTLPHPSLGDEHFDLVFLIDVIEHVPDPVALLGSCADRLAPGGTLWVVTPDAGSRVARTLGRRWWHLRVAHVGYFTTGSLVRAGRAAGLEPVHEERARWFFEVGYLADRAAQYLPVGWLVRAMRRLAPTRWLLARVIPLNLHDSIAMTFRQPPAEYDA